MPGAPGADHPRSRGDHVHSLSVYHPVKGSPPLTRGPPNGFVMVLMALRITPAHAGTTPVLLVPALHCRDHPRSRGDHFFEYVAGFLFSGSPPLTRGPPEIFGFHGDVHGITPAHAGTTQCGIPDQLRRRDHPRSRGDHRYYRLLAHLRRGSPPLTRGPLRHKHGCL